MTICDLCKKDPIATAPNEALKAAPWSVVITPPAGSCLSERRLCWPCILWVFDVCVRYTLGTPAKPKPQ